MSKQRDPVTIEQVAAAAGVSRSTVSRVVNGSSAVSPEAFEAVNRAIDDLQYVPNRAARSLASSRTQAIALVIPEDTARVFGDPFFSAIVSGISARLGDSEYVLNLVIAVDGADGKTMRYLRGGNVDGAIVISHHASDSFLDDLVASVPVVFGGRPLRQREDGGDHYVDTDNYGGAHLATDRLIAIGRRRIATITGPLDMNAGIDRLHGFRSALERAGLDPLAIEDGDFTAEGATAAVNRLIARTEPDGIFVASDLMARAVLQTLAARGIAVPEQIAVVGFDDSPDAASSTPKLTTIDQGAARQAEMMADTMVALLRGEPTDRVKIVATRLVVRESA